jgi:hypothetical protein
MQVDALNTRRILLQERFQALEADYVGVNQQIIQTRDAAERNRLQRQADDLFEQMTAVETQVKQLESTDVSYNEYYKNWEDCLPEIDFRQASRIFSYIFDRFDERGGAVFFLLQNCRPMGGKWCVEKLKSSLRNKGVWSPRPVGFSAWEQPNSTDFIRRLGASFNLEESTASAGQSTQTLIDKIYESLQIDSTVFFELRVFSLDNQSQFLDWLIQQFWIPLIVRLPTIRQKLPLVKFVAVMVVETEIPKSCLSPSLFCEKGKFNSKRIIELKLHNWTEKEIRNWLYRYSGLTAPHVGRTQLEIERMARAVYQFSQGKPLEVHSAIMEELTRVFG